MKRRLETEEEDKKPNLKVVVIQPQQFLGMADECISEVSFKPETLSDKFKRIVRINSNTSVPKIVPSYIN